MKWLKDTGLCDKLQQKKTNLFRGKQQSVSNTETKVIDNLFVLLSVVLRAIVSDSRHFHFRFAE